MTATQATEETTALETTEEESSKPETTAKETTAKKSTAKKTTGKEIKITGMPETLADEFDTLCKEFIKEHKGGKKSDFIAHLLETKKSYNPDGSAYDSIGAYGADNESKTWYQNISGNKEEGEKKLGEVKATLKKKFDKDFGDEDIKMPRREALEIVAEMSGLDIETIIENALDSEIQRLMTFHRDTDSKAGMGRMGGADSRLDKAFIRVAMEIKEGDYVPSVKGVPISYVTAGTNINTAKKWAEKRGFDFGTGMNPDVLVELAEQLEEKLKKELD